MLKKISVFVGGSRPQHPPTTQTVYVSNIIFGYQIIYYLCCMDGLEMYKGREINSRKDSVIGIAKIAKARKERKRRNIS